LRRSLDAVVVERVAAIIAEGDQDYAASLFNPGWTTAVVDPTAISAAAAHAGPADHGPRVC
jgi:hypothetical protein